jgi:Ca-activated chloride channel family protein
VATLGLLPAALNGQESGATTREATPSFKSGVDVVRISAVVRDRKGRFIRDLSIRDFEVLDAGHPRSLIALDDDRAAISIALLMDVSGSMEGAFGNAQEAATHVLAALDGLRDEAGVFTFDTQLRQVDPFKVGMQALPDRLSVMKPFGATSLHDAIAKTAEQVASRRGRRAAVIVFTDGNDNASHLTAGEVSSIASAIDVPVYIFGIVPSIDNPTADTFASTPARSVLTGSLSDLSTWTGGRTLAASTIADRSAAARQIVDELRHQYVLTFESSGTPGWHPLVIHAKGKDLTVRARTGYIAGQSRPHSASARPQDSPVTAGAF